MSPPASQQNRMAIWDRTTNIQLLVVYVTPGGSDTLIGRGQTMTRTELRSGLRKLIYTEGTQDGRHGGTLSQQIAGISELPDTSGTALRAS